jgi:NOL1/NOP2/fmu family ribosome biogenesis protein
MGEQVQMDIQVVVMEMDQEAPYAWVAPKNVEVTEETRFSWFASPYNADDIGIAPLYKNAAEGASEIVKQTSPKRNLPPSFSYEGPLAGAGFLRLFAPKPGSPEYNAYVLKQKEKKNYNPETSGITPLLGNKKTTAAEIDKQTRSSSLWERFMTGVDAGYTKKPEDENVFLTSLENAKNTLKGAIPEAPNSNLLLIGAAILLVILVLKR